MTNKSFKKALTSKSNGSQSENALSLDPLFR